MNSSKLFLGLFTIVLLCVAISLLQPTQSAAQTSFRDFIVTNRDLKDLILMLKGQNDMLKEQVSMVEEQNTMIKSQLQTVEAQNAMLKEQVDSVQEEIENLPENEPCTVPPTWSEVIGGNERFIPTTFVDGNTNPVAYCDGETGLVWDAQPNNATIDWFQARGDCLNRSVGDNGQKGWRLPSIAELASLVDKNSTSCNTGGPCVPDGSPFVDTVQADFYWSASTNESDTSFAWEVLFNSGFVERSTKIIADRARAWCVRGAMDADVY